MAIWSSCGQWTRPTPGAHASAHLSYKTELLELNPHRLAANAEGPRQDVWILLPRKLATKEFARNEQRGGERVGLTLGIVVGAVFGMEDEVPKLMRDRESLPGERVIDIHLDSPPDELPVVISKSTTLDRQTLVSRD